ncbi:MAG: DUF262 domain-containing protein [Mycoplasmataceae bacterium]|nr:DUF262 domain-containing protein [Mycoplasmataceae bacterium]
MKSMDMNLAEYLIDEWVTFSIPVYQRKYTWGKDEISRFLFDLKSLINSDTDKKHFVGSVFS